MVFRKVRVWLPAVLSALLLVTGIQQFAGGAPAGEPEVAPSDVEKGEMLRTGGSSYPRLVRLGYLVLPPSLGRNRRVLTAHALAQRALPRNRVAAGDTVMQDVANVRPRPTRTASRSTTSTPGCARSTGCR